MHRILLFSWAFFSMATGYAQEVTDDPFAAEPVDKKGKVAQERENAGFTLTFEVFSVPMAAAAALAIVASPLSSDGGF